MNINVSSQQGGFVEPKPTGTYLVPALGIREDTILFSYLSAFLSYITPDDLPVELWRDIFNSRISVLKIFLEAIKIETGFICLLIIFFFLSIIPISIFTSWCCAKKTKDSTIMDDVDRIPSVDSLLTLDAAVDNASMQCRRRCLQFLLQLIIIFLMIGVTAMFVTNEEIAIAIDKTPSVVRASLKDMQVFLKDAHRQITISVKDGMNTAIERMHNDLENIDKLLGEPIKRDIEFHTQIQLSFDSIFAICSANTGIVERVQLIKDGINDVILLSQEATTKIAELQTQLTILQSQCSLRDRPLCETLKLRNLNENGILETFGRLQGDQNLRKMLTIGEPEINGSIKNLSIELMSAKSIIKNFPYSIKQNSTRSSNEIIKYTIYMRDASESASKMLTSTVRKLLDTIDRIWSIAAPILDNFDVTSYYVWIVGLSISVITFLITIILVSGLSYGYCQAEHKGGITLIIGAAFITIGSLGLGAFSGFLMLLGGHGEIFICRTFYDHPNYHVLHELFDNPGYLYTTRPITTVLGELMRPPGIGKVSYPIGNISLTHSIHGCEHNNATFNVFQLEGLFNVTKITEINEYPELEDAIEKVTVFTKPFISLMIPIQNIIEQMIINADINLTEYRMALNNPTPEKDIFSFIDQMQRVSLQIQDVATSSRMSTLGNRARRLQSSLLQPLELVKNNILFHITALEVEREPWANQVNQSLLHLKTVQFYLNQEVDGLCLNKTKIYKERLKKHLKEVKKHLKISLNERIAKCRPLFDVFDANRLLFCNQIIDPINGLWFSTILCLILWAITIPIVLALSTIYGSLKIEIGVVGIPHTNSHQAPTDNLIISEQSNWTASNPQIASDIDRSNW